jgi:uncharacterized protein
MSVYRVLSLDGGGIRGLVTATLLERLSKQPELQGFFDSIDLIAGTSSGGLIALAMADGLGCGTMNETLGKIRGVFEAGRETFGTPWPLGGLLWPKYRTRPLRDTLQRLFGEKTLGELANRSTRVLITSFDLDNECPNVAERRWKPKLFHNIEPTTDGARNDSHEKAWEVGLYTAAAPAFFPTCGGYIDGGVYANNPSMCALAQVFDRRYKTSLPSASELGAIRLFSVSAGRNHKFIAGNTHHWGVLWWGRDFVELSMDGSMGIAHYECEQLLSDRSYRRLEPCFGPGRHVRLDDLSQIDYLKDFATRVPLDADVEWLHHNWAPASVPQDLVEV